MDEPKNAEEILKDFMGRRAGIIKALTKDAELLYAKCYPENPYSLCLFGLPNKQWKLSSPNYLPSPKPINFIRYVKPKDDWFFMVAFHSHAWLHAVAAYFAVKLNFDKTENKRLFNKITDLPSVCEIMQKKISKKRAKLCGGLPKDVIMEVLSRVPVLDILNCGFVCELWDSVINDPCFTLTHLNNYKFNSNGNHLLAMELLFTLRKRKKQVMVRRSDSFRKVVQVDWSKFSDPLDYWDVICYVNGVMLMRKGIYMLPINEIVLWNPSLKNVFVKIPNKFHQMGIRTGSFYELALGFDVSSGYDCKVIAVVYPNVDRYQGGREYYWLCAKNPGRVEVYDLCMSSWTTIDGVECPMYWCSGSQVYFNGAIHWRSLGPKFLGESWTSTKRESHLVAFDVENKVFKYIQLPDEASVANERITLMVAIVVDESLGMFYGYISHNDIWVMEKYGDEGSWSKRYKFCQQFHKFLHFKVNGEFLFEINRKSVKSYDVKRDQVRDVGKFSVQSSQHNVYTFVESLLLLKHGTSK